MKIKFGVLGGVVLALMLSACGQKGADEIRIGVPGAHSGDLASYGLPTVNAAELVAEQVNQAGGLLGKQIRLFVEDDQCQPEVATNIAAKLVGDGVVGVLGHICSGATRTALGIYTGEGIVVVSPSATSPPLTQSGEFPTFFRTIAPDDAQGALQAEFVAEKLGARSVAILHDGGDYGRGLADFARESLTENYPDVKIALYEGITVGAVDYSAIINRVGASNVDVLIYGGYHPEASRLVSQMRSQGMDLPFISGDGIQDETFIDVAGANAEGVYATGPRDTSGNPVAQAARRAHQEKYGEEPGPFFMNAYSGMLALVNAIEVAGSTDSAAIQEALRTSPVQTPVGEITFDERGDAIGIGFAIYQVQNGVYVELQ
ncbi:branched-chain amino acid transport system substrate-binding protein [Alkalispirochaeta americana]|uniref:Branched-chain amino acid transport system substrate-binding protein n=1 Tax=Alkalispirochaeta americana TaxID=159291 RepID=A0A1N6TYL3_9SPIO|nr:branched-chain amino acid ABC transporter substrate-binding protein [Alkalispirochaeta americana]SIQ58414.1 branched-chain amino acid transport system substrate-binding protein [Alkalispirochaeta americana]